MKDKKLKIWTILVMKKRLKTPNTRKHFQTLKMPIFGFKKIPNHLMYFHFKKKVIQLKLNGISQNDAKTIEEK